jgi:hypothetical protein
MEQSRFEDMYNWDFPTLLKNSTFKRKRVEEELIYFDFECTLEFPFMNSFDTLIIEQRSEGKEIDIDGYIGLTFLSKKKPLSYEQIAYVVNSVVSACNDNTPYTKRTVPAFIAGQEKYLSIDLNDDISVAIKNDVTDGVFVHIHILYTDLLQLARDQN